MTVQQMRRLRNEVRTTLKLVSGGHQIGEKLGSWWRINLDTGVVEWIAKWPFPPYTAIDQLGIIFCLAHEASHRRYSGRYTTKMIDPADRGRFHRFVNGIEDIRCDRQSAREYSSFWEAKIHVNLLLRTSHQPQGWTLVDAVAMNALYAIDIGEPLQGTPFQIAASERLWPKLDRIANVDSTQRVATALEPIFLELRKIEKDEAERKRKEEEAKREAERKQREEEERKRQEEEDERRREEEADAEEADDEAEEADGDEQDDEPESGEDGGEREEFGDPLEPEADEPPPIGDGGEPDDEEADDDSEPGDEDDEAPGGGLPGDAEDESEDDGDQEGAGGSGDGEEGDEEEDGTGTGDGEDDGEEEDGDGEEGEDDPFGGLDEIEDAGEDEPTDRPVKSDGDPGTDPLAFGEDLEGLAEDATDQQTRDALRRDAMRRDAAKQEAKEEVARVEGGRTYPTSTGINKYERQLAKCRGQVDALAARLTSILRHNALARPTTGHRRGRLDTKKAYRAAAGNPRIFKRPGTVGGHDYTFGLLVDTSSSMWSTTFRDRNGMYTSEAMAAFEATVLIAEALEKAKLRVFVILWDHRMPHVMPLGEPLAAHRGPIGTVFSGSGGSNTVEAPAIARAMEEFRKVPNRRMLITISDGETVTIDESTELLAELSAEGIESVAVRIGGDPAPYYKNGYRVEHADELVQVLPQIINNVVART